MSWLIYLGGCLIGSFVAFFGSKSEVGAASREGDSPSVGGIQRGDHSERWSFHRERGSVSGL